MRQSFGVTPKKWAETAAANLAAARLLCREGHLPQSVFSTQQSAEAAFKGFVLLWRPRTSESVLRKDIGHEPLTWFTRVLRDAQMQSVAEVLAENLKAAHRSLTPKLIREMLRVAREQEADTQRFAEENFARLRDGARLDHATTVAVGTAPMRAAMARVLAAAFIVHPHAILSRYGDGGGKAPSEIYSSGHALVEALADVFDFLHETIESLQQLAKSRGRQKRRDGRPGSPS